MNMNLPGVSVIAATGAFSRKSGAADSARTAVASGARDDFAFLG
jgi:hypothetical protein